MNAIGLVHKLYIESEVKLKEKWCIRYRHTILEEKQKYLMCSYNVTRYHNSILGMHTDQ